MKKNEKVGSLNNLNKYLTWNIKKKREDSSKQYQE